MKRTLINGNWIEYSYKDGWTGKPDEVDRERISIYVSEGYREGEIFTVDHSGKGKHHSGWWKLRVKKVRKPRLKIRSVDVHCDGSPDRVLLLDEGQDFTALYRAFNKQDHPVTNKDWMGFTEFMEANKVKILSQVNNYLDEYL
jgi:hypothetical protein